jgi:hypothetical protein
MISTNNQQVDKEKFESNFDSIFGSKPVQRGTFVMRDGKLVLKTEAACTQGQAIHIHKDFVSPIDGSHITSAKQLAAHNKKHGVTNSSDYSDGYIARKAEQRNSDGAKHLKDTRHHEVTNLVDTILRQR